MALPFGQPLRLEAEDAPASFDLRSRRDAARLFTTNQPPIKIYKQKLKASGALVELARVKKPGKELSLRNPADPEKDGQNLVTEPKTGRVIGFRLFSLSF